jgi:RNA polymerase primary sigma factor
MTRKKIVTAEDVRELKKLLDTEYLTSLDAPMSEDSESSFSEFLKDEHAVDPLAEAMRNAMVEAVHSVLDSLPSRDRQILSMRYGIGFPRPMTMEEIGAEFSLSRERVRQIENAAMKTLRHPSRMRKMRPYSDGTGKQP